MRLSVAFWVCPVIFVSFVKHFKLDWESSHLLSAQYVHSPQWTFGKDNSETPEWWLLANPILSPHSVLTPLAALSTPQVLCIFSFWDCDRSRKCSWFFWDFTELKTEQSQLLSSSHYLFIACHCSVSCRHLLINKWFKLETLPRTLFHTGQWETLVYSDSTQEW